MMEQQYVVLKANFQQLTAAVNAYSAIFEKNGSSDDLSEIGEISQCHVKLLQKVKQMQSAVYGPLNMILLHFEEASLPAYLI